MAGFFWCLLSATTGTDESSNMMFQWQWSSQLHIHTQACRRCLGNSASGRSRRDGSRIRSRPNQRIIQWRTATLFLPISSHSLSPPTAELQQHAGFYAQSNFFAFQHCHGKVLLPHFHPLSQLLPVSSLLSHYNGPSSRPALHISNHRLPSPR